MLSDGEKPKGSPSRPLEFLPVVVDILPDYHNNQAAFTLWAVDATEEDNSIKEFNDLSDAMSLLKYSHVSRHPTDKHLMRVYTNMRALISAGIPYEKIPYNKSEDLESFVAIKANIPMFVWAQVPNTHTQISKEAQSDRVAENNSYWLPSDFRDRLFHLTKDGTESGKPIDPEPVIGWQGIYQLQDGTKIGKVAQYLLMCTTHEELVQEILALSQIESQNLFKVLGYPREIWSRAMYYFKYKEVVMTGWMSDPNVWKHLFYERNGYKNVWKNWTQSETEQFVKCIQELIG